MPINKNPNDIILSAFQELHERNLTTDDILLRNPLQTLRRLKSEEDRQEQFLAERSNVSVLEASSKSLMNNDDNDDINESHNNSVTSARKVDEDEFFSSPTTKLNNNETSDVSGRKNSVVSLTGFDFPTSFIGKEESGLIGMVSSAMETPTASYSNNGASHRLTEEQLQIRRTERRRKRRYQAQKKKLMRAVRKNFLEELRSGSQGENNNNNNNGDLSNFGMKGETTASMTTSGIFRRPGMIKIDDLANDDEEDDPKNQVEFAFRDHFGIDTARACKANEKMFAKQMGSRYSTLKANVIEFLQEGARRKQQEQEQQRQKHEQRQQLQLEKVQSSATLLSSGGLNSQSKSLSKQSLLGGINKTMSFQQQQQQQNQQVKSGSSSATTPPILTPKQSQQMLVNNKTNNNNSQQPIRDIREESMSLTSHPYNDDQQQQKSQLQSSANLRSPTLIPVSMDDPSTFGLSFHSALKLQQQHQSFSTSSHPLSRQHTSMRQSMTNNNNNNNILGGAAIANSFVASLPPPPSVSTIMSKLILPPLSLDAQHDLDKQAESRDRRKQWELETLFNKCLTWAMKRHVLEISDVHELKPLPVEKALVQLHTKLRDVRKLKPELHNQGLFHFLEEALVSKSMIQPSMADDLLLGIDSSSTQRRRGLSRASRATGVASRMMKTTFTAKETTEQSNNNNATFGDLVNNNTNTNIINDDGTTEHPSIQIPNSDDAMLNFSGSTRMMGGVGGDRSVRLAASYHRIASGGGSTNSGNNSSVRSRSQNNNNNDQSMYSLSSPGAHSESRFGRSFNAASESGSLYHRKRSQGSISPTSAASPNNSAALSSSSPVKTYDKTESALEVLRKRLEEQEKSKQWADVLRLYGNENKTGSPLNGSGKKAKFSNSSSVRQPAWKQSGSVKYDDAAIYKNNKSGSKKKRKTSPSKKRHHGRHTPPVSSAGATNSSSSANNNNNENHHEDQHHKNKKKSTRSNSLHIPGEIASAANDRVEEEKRLEKMHEVDEVRWYFSTKQELEQQLAHEHNNNQRKQSTLSTTSSSSHHNKDNNNTSTTSSPHRIPRSNPPVSATEIISNLAPFAKVVDVTFLEPKTIRDNPNTEPTVAHRFTLKNVGNLDQIGGSSFKMQSPEKMAQEAVAKRLAEGDHILGTRGYITVIPHDNQARKLLTSTVNQEAASKYEEEQANPFGFVGTTSTSPVGSRRPSNNSNNNNIANTNTTPFDANKFLSDVKYQARRQSSTATTILSPQQSNVTSSSSGRPTPTDNNNNNMNSPVFTRMQQYSPRPTDVMTTSQRSLQQFVGPLKFGGLIHVAAPDTKDDVVGTEEFIAQNFDLEPGVAKKIVGKAVEENLFPTKAPPDFAELQKKHFDSLSQEEKDKLKPVALRDDWELGHHHHVQPTTRTGDQAAGRVSFSDDGSNNKPFASPTTTTTVPIRYSTGSGSTSPTATSPTSTRTAIATHFQQKQQHQQAGHSVVSPPSGISPSSTSSPTRQSNSNSPDNQEGSGEFDAPPPRQTTTTAVPSAFSQTTTISRDVSNNNSFATTADGNRPQSSSQQNSKTSGVSHLVVSAQRSRMNSISNHQQQQQQQQQAAMTTEQQPATQQQPSSPKTTDDPQIENNNNNSNTIDNKSTGNEGNNNTIIRKQEDEHDISEKLLSPSEVRQKKVASTTPSSTLILSSPSQKNNDDNKAVPNKSLLLGSQNNQSQTNKHITRLYSHEKSLSSVPVPDRVYRVVYEMPYLVGIDEVNPFVNDPESSTLAISHKKEERVLNDREDAELERVNEKCKRHLPRGARIAKKPVTNTTTVENDDGGVTTSFLARQTFERYKFHQSSMKNRLEEQQQAIGAGSSRSVSPPSRSRSRSPVQQQQEADTERKTKEMYLPEEEEEFKKPTTPNIRLSYLPPGVRFPRRPTNPNHRFTAASIASETAFSDANTATIDGTQKLLKEKTRIVNRKKQILELQQQQQQQQQQFHQDENDMNNTNSDDIQPGKIHQVPMIEQQQQQQYQEDEKESNWKSGPSIPMKRATATAAKTARTMIKTSSSATTTTGPRRRPFAAATANTARKNGNNDNGDFSFNLTSKKLDVSVARSGGFGLAGVAKMS